MRLVTKRFNSSVGIVVDFSLDDNGNPVPKSQKTVVIEDFECGTRIRMQLPITEYSAREQQLLRNGTVVAN